jgi:hypothetical protein
MRLPLSFLGACLMALGLFALMLYMVAPPRAKPSEEPVSVANFVRMDGNASETASRTRQQAPQPPQPQTPQPPTPPTPQTATPSARLGSWISSCPAWPAALPSTARRRRACPAWPRARRRRRRRAPRPILAGRWAAWKAK